MLRIGSTAWRDRNSILLVCHGDLCSWRIACQRRISAQRLLSSGSHAHGRFHNGSDPLDDSSARRGKAVSGAPEKCRQCCRCGIAVNGVRAPQRVLSVANADSDNVCDQPRTEASSSLDIRPHSSVAARSRGTSAGGVPCSLHLGAVPSSIYREYAPPSPPVLPRMRLDFGDLCRRSTAPPARLRFRTFSQGPRNRPVHRKPPNSKCCGESYRLDHTASS